jgi:NADH:ubiquinone oxidoreductase subunit 6 (subunit J)
MFRFWFRELIGWLLIAIGLYVFAVCLSSLATPPAPGVYGLLEAPILTVIGIFIFRGGIHLLKVAVAARLSLRTHEELRKQKAEKPKTVDTPWDW